MKEGGGGGCGLTETAATACFPDGADLSTEHLQEVDLKLVNCGAGQ